MRTWTIGLLTLTAPFTASAQPLPGFYLGAGGGLSVVPSSRLDALDPRPAPDHAAPRAPIISANSAPRSVASLGYAFGNGVRVELEGTARR